jgi:two-component system LytT family response regulator
MVVDDEPLLAESLGNILSDYEFELVGSFSNPCEALDKIGPLKPDVLFLDIEMPELNGLELAERAQSAGYEGEVVFITAYNQYAVEAFSVNALDYLLKPIIEKDLERTVFRLRKRLGNTRLNHEQQVHFLNITMFGPFSALREEGHPIHWITTKCAELFAFLLLQKGNEVRKESLMDIIFPDKTISRLNTTLRENGVPLSVVSTGKGYQLRKDSLLKLDVDAFHLEALEHDADVMDATSARRYERVLTQYRGMLLENYEGEWCEIYRTRFHLYFVSAMKALIQYYIKMDTEYLKILSLIATLTKYEPYDDAAHGWAMQFRYRLTGKQDVQAYYNQYKDLLGRELGEKPGEKLNKLYEELMENI